jgi:hypothetical protein
MARALQFIITITEHGGHLYMDDKDHSTDALTCWCQPKFYRSCDECTDDEPWMMDRQEQGDQRNGCWKCEDGLIELTQREANAVDEPLVILHNVK